jgi:hypothetical protein
MKKMKEIKIKTGITIGAFLLSGIPIIGFMLGMIGMIPLSKYVFIAIVPMIVALISLSILSLKNDREFFNKIVSGTWIGIVATIFLDIFRIISVKIGWIPMDVPMVLGAKILGLNPMQMDSSQMVAPLIVGNLYHFLNGITFTIVYVLLFGKGNTRLGAYYGILIWIGMMVLPPMPMMVGFFGIKTGSLGLGFGTLVAHIAYGLVVGILAKRFVRSKGMFYLHDKRKLTTSS